MVYINTLLVQTLLSINLVNNHNHGLKISNNKDLRMI
jgi:hypothetical protein